MLNDNLNDADVSSALVVYNSSGSRPLLVTLHWNSDGGCDWPDETRIPKPGENDNVGYELHRKNELETPLRSGQPARHSCNF